MKQIAIVSGKGGTGKTVIAGGFATMARHKVMVDCDVDAANLHLLLHPAVKETHQFTAGKKARIDREQCNQCGRCKEVCRYEAIASDPPEAGYAIDPVACEGCGVCFLICPQSAISMNENPSGEWYISDTKYGPFVHATLGIGEENSGKLVSEVRKQAKELAESHSLDYIIIDGPPGIGCPVIASLGGADLALIVTESTLSGIHDMERIVGLASHFQVEVTVCINRYDLNLRNAKSLEAYCQESGIEVMGKIPFDPRVVESVRRGMPFTEYSDSAAAAEMRTICERVLKSA